METETAIVEAPISKYIPAIATQTLRMRDRDANSRWSLGQLAREVKLTATCQCCRDVYRPVLLTSIVDSLCFWAFNMAIDGL